jgi:glutathione-regulated potassium-efflux system ancillary protein KefC
MGSPFPDLDCRISYAFLFSSGGNFCFHTGAYFSSTGFFLLLAGKVFSKIFGLFQIIGIFRKKRDERWYYSLLMSTGLTFGTISALYGLSHNIVTQQQYSFLVAVVIGSAVVPTLIAGLFFLPRHLLPAMEQPKESVLAEDGMNEEG